MIKKPIPTENDDPSVQDEDDIFAGSRIIKVVKPLKPSGSKDDKPDDDDDGGWI